MNEQDLKIKIARLEALLEVKQEMLDLLKDILKNHKNDTFRFGYVGVDKAYDKTYTSNAYKYTTFSTTPYILSGEVRFSNTHSTEIFTDPYWKDGTAVT
jgi:hypothetical protein